MQQVMTGIDDVDVFYFIMFFLFFVKFMFLLINKDGLCYSGLQVHDGVVLNFVCHFKLIGCHECIHTIFHVVIPI